MPGGPYSVHGVISLFSERCAGSWSVAAAKVNTNFALGGGPRAIDTQLNNGAAV